MNPLSFDEAEDIYLEQKIEEWLENRRMEDEEGF